MDKRVFRPTLVFDINDEHNLIENIDNKENVVVVVDSAKSAKKWKDYPVIGVDKSLSYFSGADYVVESIEDIDDSFAYMVWCRKWSKPLIIGYVDDICIREMTAFDADNILALYEDEECKKYLKRPDLNINNEKYSDVIKRYQKSMYELYGFGMWVLEQNGTIIGRVGFDFDNEEIFLGYVISSDYRNKKIATRACQIALDYIKDFGFKNVFCTVEKTNLPSLHLAKKLGFVYSHSEMREDKEYKIYKFTF